jgi:hypothetical protein
MFRDTCWYGHFFLVLLCGTHAQSLSAPFSYTLYTYIDCKFLRHFTTNHKLLQFITLRKVLRVIERGYFSVNTPHAILQNIQFPQTSPYAFGCVFTISPSKILTSQCAEILDTRRFKFYYRSAQKFIHVSNLRLTFLALHSVNSYNSCEYK